MKEHSTWYGKMEVSPSTPIVAGSYGTWKLTYTVGRYGMDNGGRIRLLFRYAWDGGTPQTIDPTADNYVTAYTSNPNAKVVISYMPKGGRRPWLPCVVFEIIEDSLAEGEQVYITFGDTSGGSKGHRAQTFVESDFRWLTDVECFETGTWVELEESPITPIISAEPHRVVALAPSEATVNDNMHMTIKCEDVYGNPVHNFNGSVKLRLQKHIDETVETCSKAVWDGPDSYQFVDADKGCHRLEGLRLKESGFYSYIIEANQIGVKSAESNIIHVSETKSELTHYWGDLHAQQNNALGTGSVEEAWRYARDAGGIDFVGHQPNDFQFREEGWEEVKKAIPKFHVPGKFIPFLGYEWSGTTPAGGDRNVHFLYDDGPLHRSSHWHIPDKSDEHMDRYPLDKLYATFKGRDDVLIVPHVGGRRCDISKYYEPELEPVIEICSCHGRFEWLLHEALENGYTVGVVGGSDDHTGRPGAAYATSHSFGTRGGLAGVYAKELTRQGIFDALRARHTYATTGERIWLHVSTIDGKFMGDAWEGKEAPTIQIKAAGTQPIERVEIFRNSDIVYAYPLFHEEDYSPNLIRIEWGGAHVKGRGRHSTWDGKLTVENGSIISAKTFAFDHPKQGITHQDKQSVSWISTTSGDHDGIILELDGSNDTVLHFYTKLGQETVSVESLLNGSIRKDCGGVDQYYLFALQPIISGPRTINFIWQDKEPINGRNAYWIRLVQEDGEIAWSSPLYFTKK